MTRTKFTIGALIGAAAGIVAGFLTAPKSGRETRADIKSKAEELKNQAAQKADEAKAKVGDVADAVKAKADDYKERGEKAVRDVQRDLTGKKK